MLTFPWYEPHVQEILAIERVPVSEEIKRTASEEVQSTSNLEKVCFDQQ